MNDEQRLEEWFSDREEAPDSVQRGVARVMTEVPQTRQQGRWLPLPIHRPKARTPTATATDTTEYQPSPVPASNGHTPTVIGRTSSMLSPVKAITAGALVFAIGGTLLIAQPFHQPASVPGAETDMAPATFTVALADEPVVTTDGTGTTKLVGEWESTEERASGTLTQVVASAPVDVADGDGGLVQRLAVQLLNDGGSWVGSSRGFLTFPSDGPETVQFLGELVGEGGYEGLTMFFAETGDTEDVRWLGVIVPTGDIPAVPDLPAE